MGQALREVLKAQKAGEARGLCSVCSSNPYVIRAALRRAQRVGSPLLIEATANQVDQNGGYTGMRPQDFRALVLRLAQGEGVPEEDIILGGDHLGPLTRSHLPEEEAMAYAKELVRAYAEAGFSKIHLDTSMPLAGDGRGEAFERSVARRGAELCLEVERALEGRGEREHQVCYVIGSEVPVPGGAREAHEIHVSLPEDCAQTFALYERAFAERGLSEALSRVVALVVQPGVEFSDDAVQAYDRAAALELTRFARERLPFMLEGHSTDYQSRDCLRQMVEDGIGILKVGPALTFALREALFSLELIERELFWRRPRRLSRFAEVLERAMLSAPGHWERYYRGSFDEQRLARRYSLLDRQRYYLDLAEVRESVEQLMANFEGTEIPASLLSQYFSAEFEALRAGRLAPQAEALIFEHIGRVLDDYYAACGYRLA